MRTSGNSPSRHLGELGFIVSLSDAWDHHTLCVTTPNFGHKIHSEFIAVCSTVAVRFTDEKGHSRSSRVVIADDHPLFRTAIKQSLREWPDLVVVGEAADGWEVVKLCRRLHPELVLMDLWMPRMDGFEATREIKRQSPSTIVLAVTAFWGA